MAIISNKSLYVNNHRSDQCCEINLNAKRVLLIATILRIVVLSKSITPLKVLIRSTLSKLPLPQSNTSISNNPKSSSKYYTARITSVGQQSNTQSKISVKTIGGNKIDASILISIGAESYGFDSTKQQIQKANSANLLVYNGGSMKEPWIFELSPQNEVDASKGINLLTNPSDPEIKGTNNPQWSRFEEQRYWC
jgi:hypothetical protein